MKIAGNFAAKLAALRKPALLLAGLLLAGLVLRLIAAEGGAGLLARLSGAHDPAAVLLLGLVGSALCAVGLPRQMLAFACGYALGAWAGAALALLTQVLGCAADFIWARAVARDWARRRIAASPRLARMDVYLGANPFTATLTLRLLPVGNNLALNLLAGVSAVGFAPFLAGSALGYLPQTIIFTLIGSGAHVDRGVQLGVGIALFLISAGVGLVVLRRQAGKGAVLAGPL